MKAMITLVATAIVYTAPLSAFAAEPADVDTSIAVLHFDKETWVKTVSGANLFEIETSQLAKEKATSQEVKSFAQQMIDDHTKAGTKLADILKKHGGTPPPAVLAPKHADALALLKKAEGVEFDEAYKTIQHGAHLEAVTVFRIYAAKPDDPDLGAFATETLPTLEMHLEHVKAMIAE